MREHVVVGDVVAEVEGRVDHLARLAHAQRLGGVVLGLGAGALGALHVALAQFLDGAVTQERHRQR